MKKYQLFICLIAFSWLSASGQSIEPLKSTVVHNGAERPCLMVNLAPDPKTLKNAWMDFLRKKHDFKLKGMGWFSNQELLYANEVIIDSISSKNMDFYTQVIEVDDFSEMKVFASLGYDIYLNEEQYPLEFKAMNSMLTNFLTQYLPKYYSRKIKESEQKINNLNREINRLKSDTEKSSNDIDIFNRKIEKSRSNIEGNNREIATTESNLVENQQKLETLRSKLE